MHNICPVFQKFPDKETKFSLYKLQNIIMSVSRHIGLLIFIGSLSPVIGMCQFTGGSNDGFTYLPLLKTTIIDANAFKGGTSDGFVVTFLSKTDISDAAAFKGGSNDGFETVINVKTTINDPAAFKGGSSDGFNLMILSKTDFTDAAAFKGGGFDGFNLIFLSGSKLTDANAFKGGNSDGFQYILLSKTNITDAIAFAGGIGRGETQGGTSSCNGEILLWIGNISSDWGNPDNWECGVLPNKGSTVIIPFGVPNYPKVSANFEIKKLMLHAKADMMIMPGISFKINGQ